MADDTAPLVIANLILAAIVIAPAFLVISAGVCQLAHRIRRRPTEQVEIPGVGRILVLRK